MQPDVEKELSQAVQALDISLLPSELSPEFGGSDVKFFCAMLGLSFSDVKFVYMDYKGSGGSKIFNELLKLRSVFDTIPVSTTTCKRGFSKRHIICSPMCAQLIGKLASSLMFVSLSCPPIILFEPLKYARSWLVLNQHSAR